MASDSLDSSDESSGADEPSTLELLSGSGSGRWQRSHDGAGVSPRHFFAVAVGLALLLACAALAAASVRQRAEATPTSVRALLESPELADAAAVSFAESFDHHGLEFETARASMAENFANISRHLRDTYPEEYGQLTAAQLTPGQRASAVSLLRHYGDPRMVRLAHDTAAAAQETAAAGGDHASLKRRLMEKLQPQVEGLRQLCHEIYGGEVECQKFTLREDALEELQPVKDFDRWHMQLKVTSARRLSATAAKNAPVQELQEVAHGQVKTLFQQLHGMLGDKVPLAPLRHLDFNPFRTQQQQLQEQTFTERLLNCLETGYARVDFPDIIPGVEAFITCVASTMPHLWSWMSTEFIKLTGRPLPSHFDSTRSSSNTVNTGR